MNTGFQWSDLSEVFNLLHDGVIVEGMYEGQQLNLKIEIPYLADIINPDYSWFYLTLNGCSSVHFEPWDERQTQILSSTAIFSQRINILDAQMQGERLLISCSVVGKKTSFGGGRLIIEAESIKVFDEDLIATSLEDLKGLAAKYWKNMPTMER